MHADAQFWDRIAAKYARKPVADPDAYEQTLDRTRSWLKPGDRALELGCGTGSTAMILAPSVSHLTAADISGAMIDIARQKAAAAGMHNLDFEVSDFPGAARSGEPLDTVLAFNLLHLVPDLDATLSDIRSALKPGGLFISKSPCLSGSLMLKLAVRAMTAVGKAPRVRFFSVAELEERIVRAGFEIVEVGSYPDGSTPSRFVVARRP